MAKRRIYTAPGSQVVDIATGTARLEKLDGEIDSYVLHVNGVPSSSITLSDPQRLDFEYLDWMRRAIDVVLPDGSLRAAHIGAAGCALARALDAARPGSKQTAIDIDAKLLDYAREWFDLPRSPALAMRAGDGAAEIGKFRPDTLDVLVRDAFDHDSVPPGLQNPEFFAACATAVKETGLYLANVPDAGDHSVLKSELHALGEHFAHLAAATEPAILKGRRRGNVVVLASHTPLPTAGLDRALRTAASSATFLSGQGLRSRLGL
ncbi:spermidine synthase [Brevibacterium spongiae]|uniref:Fused MFS/spermidine synthase n=1 Tax=Brevibacterium spongiae TaxID=2909672 RepID=A0ABY5SKE2_9MICO|nr:fused MFS/spermidine synthase [Brevibacterium spongiae]UVI34625.1 fused MFS/spermidine synthase [Brevibacterium spongiae]